MQTHDQSTEAPTGREPERWLEDAIGRDPVLGPLLSRLRPLAASDGPALVMGPPGSGRELVARTSLPIVDDAPADEAPAGVQA